MTVAELLEVVWRYVGYDRVPSDYQLLQLATDLRDDIKIINESVDWPDEESTITGNLATASIDLPSDLSKETLRVRVNGQDVSPISWPYDDGSVGYYLHTAIDPVGVARQSIILVGYDTEVADNEDYEIRAVFQATSLIPVTSPQALYTNLSAVFDRLLVAQLVEQFAQQPDSALVRRLLSSANAAINNYKLQRFDEISRGNADNGYEEWD